MTLNLPIVSSIVKLAFGPDSSFSKARHEVLKRQLLEENLKNASDYSQWLDAAVDLDMATGIEQWKADKKSDLYDYELIEQRLNQLREARIDQDAEQILLLLRTTLQRNLGNLGNPLLYTKSYSGTKYLIEEYILECEAALNYLIDSKDIDSTRLLSTLVQTRKAYGRTALVLSGGSVFGLLHTGVIDELRKVSLLPRIVSGSSAGAIIASVLSIHQDDELDGVMELLKREYYIFDPAGPGETTKQKLARFLKYGTWFDNKYLQETMRELVGDLTFQEAYYRTRRVLNVTVSSSSIHEMPRLLNYLTAPNVLIWSAVCASCSVPLVFSSYDILAKNTKTGEHYSWTPATFIDGSVDNDLPMSRLAEMFNVNHFIACQVNPHVVPFLRVSEAFATIYGGNSWAKSLARVLSYAQELISEELSHLLLMTGEAGIFTTAMTKVRSVVAQTYTGDITILPPIKFSEFLKMFNNPDADFIAATKVRAARATWPKLAIIRNHCAIELELDRAVNTVRSRMIPRRDATHMKQVRSTTEMYRCGTSHVRRRSEGMTTTKYIARKSSLTSLPDSSKKKWKPSPPLSARSSYVTLTALGNSNSIGGIQTKKHEHRISLPP